MLVIAVSRATAIPSPKGRGLAAAFPAEGGRNHVTVKITLEPAPLAVLLRIAARASGAAASRKFRRSRRWRGWQRHHWAAGVERCSRRWRRRRRAPQLPCPLAGFAG